MRIPPALAAATAGLPPATVAKDWKAAQGFAATAIGELFQPMFATVDLSKSRFGGGAGEAAWQPILVQAIGREVASEGGLGISAIVFNELIHQQQAATVAPHGAATAMSNVPGAAK